MDNKTFLNISEEECLIAYQEMINNSDKCWESGKVLALSGDYARAVSTSIISIEELIKAMIILFDGNGFEFRKTEGIVIFFKNHEIRYVLAYILFVGGSLMIEAIDILSKILKDPEEIKKAARFLDSDSDFFVRRIVSRMLRKFILLKNEMEWFSKIDIIRQNGFYSDYNGKLKSPIDISENEYNEVVEKFGIVRELAKGIASSFKSQKGTYDKLRTQYKTKNVYSEIEKVLDLIKKRRRKPFELLKENFDNMTKQ